MNTDRSKHRMERLREIELEQQQWEQDALVMPEVRPMCCSPHDTLLPKHRPGTSCYCSRFDQSRQNLAISTGCRGQRGAATPIPPTPLGFVPIQIQLAWSHDSTVKPGP